MSTLLRFAQEKLRGGFNVAAAQCLIVCTLIATSSAQPMELVPVPPALLQHKVSYYRVDAEPERRIVVELFDAGRILVGKVEFMGQTVGAVTKMQAGVTFSQGPGEWATYEADRSAGELRTTSATSSGSTLRMAMKLAPGTRGSVSRVDSVSLYDGEAWKEIPYRNISVLRAEERKIFGTPGLQLALAVIENLGELLLAKRAVPWAALFPGRRGDAVLRPVSIECGCTCARLVVLRPNFLCVEEALPDVCICPECDWGASHRTAL